MRDDVKVLESVAEQVLLERPTLAVRPESLPGAAGDWQPDGDGGWVLTVNTPTARWFVFLCRQQWVGSAA